MDIELEENLVLPAIIDQRAAATPKRLYVVLVDPNPDNPDDLQVRKITYGEFANAVNNAAWWLERTIGKPSVPFETLAYCGLADLRNIIFTLAAVKVGFTLLLLHPKNSVAAQEQLLESTACSKLLVSEEFTDTLPLPKDFVWRDTLLASPKSATEELSENTAPPKEDFILFDSLKCAIAVSGLDAWFEEPVLQKVVYPFRSPLRGNENKPFVILHTSGSTGLPDSVTYTYGSINALRYYATPQTLIPNCPTSAISLWQNKAMYTGFPPSHMIGTLCLGPGTVFWNMPVILGPATQPPTAELASKIHELDICKSALLPPSILSAMKLSQEHLDSLRKLDFVLFCGAPLSAAHAATLKNYVSLQCAYGTTETGPITLNLEDQEFSEYMSFSPIAGVQFRQYDDELFELIIARSPDAKLRKAQMVHYHYPAMGDRRDTNRTDGSPVAAADPTASSENLERINGESVASKTHAGQAAYHRTKDLFVQHPEKSGLWKYMGRRDDIQVLSTGNNINPLPMEALVSSHPDVSAALFVGTDLEFPVWLIEPIKSAEQELFDKLWPVIKMASQKGPAFAMVDKTRVLFVLPGGMKRAAKGSVQRKLTVEAYWSQIKELGGARTG